VLARAVDDAALGGLFRSLVEAPRVREAAAVTAAAGREMSGSLGAVERAGAAADGFLEDLGVASRAMPADPEAADVRLFAARVAEGVASLADEQRAASAALAEARARLAELEARCEAALGEARRDALTGLHNRRAFDEALDRESDPAVRADTPLALLALDIDHFKSVNDSLGHAAGDAVLRAVADAVKATVRQCDLVARTGGEEFAVLLPGATADAAAGVAERIRRRVESLRLVNDAGRPMDRTFSVSVGVATLGPGEAGTSLLGRADARLYVAKRTGRNRVAT
jgi:diguanylate cyclase